MTHGKGPNQGRYKPTKRDTLLTIAQLVSTDMDFLEGVLGDLTGVSMMVEELLEEMAD